MKRSVVPVIVMVGAVVCAPLGLRASPVAQSTAPQSAEAEIRQLNAAEVDAFLRKDPRAMLRFTGVWMKQQGRWQQLARHANIVAQP